MIPVHHRGRPRATAPLPLLVLLVFTSACQSHEFVGTAGPLPAGNGQADAGATHDEDLATSGNKSDTDAKSARSQRGDATGLKVSAPSNGHDATPRRCSRASRPQDLQWPANVQACIDAGHVWDFWGQRCSNLGPAVTFPCTVDGVRVALDHQASIADGVRRALLNLASAIGGQGPTPATAVLNVMGTRGLLLGCGEKVGTIVAAHFWVTPVESDGTFPCNVTPRDDDLMLLCFRTDLQTDHDVTAPDEIKKLVSTACLNQGP